MRKERIIKAWSIFGAVLAVTIMLMGVAVISLAIAEGVGWTANVNNIKMRLLEAIPILGAVMLLPCITDYKAWHPEQNEEGSHKD